MPIRVKEVTDFVQIDNPASRGAIGNCGFYALAISLIHIIQQEGTEHGTYGRWVRLCPSLSNYYNSIRDFHLVRQDEDLLEIMQYSLRELLCRLFLDTLREFFCRSGDISNHPLYLNFKALSSIKKDDYTDSRFNFLMDTPFTASLKCVDSSEESFLELLFGAEVIVTPETPFLENSLIIEVMKERLYASTYWAIAQDIELLAKALEVSFGYYCEKKENARMIKCSEYALEPRVVFFNRDSHWTSLIPTDEMDSKYPIDGIETKKSAKASRVIASFFSPAKKMIMKIKGSYDALKEEKSLSL